MLWTETGMENDKNNESPFACDMAALDATQRRRWDTLLRQLNEKQQELQELPDGYALRFTSESQVVRDVAEFITYERLCCAFFDLELAVEREGGPLWLRIKGREGVKYFIRSEFGF
jgi:hypothetical protein